MTSRSLVEFDVACRRLAQGGVSVRSIVPQYLEISPPAHMGCRLADPDIAFLDMLYAMGPPLLSARELHVEMTNFPILPFLENTQAGARLTLSATTAGPGDALVLAAGLLVERAKLTGPLTADALPSHLARSTLVQESAIQDGDITVTLSDSDHGDGRHAADFDLDPKRRILVLIGTAIGELTSPYVRILKTRLAEVDPNPYAAAQIFLSESKEARLERFLTDSKYGLHQSMGGTYIKTDDIATEYVDTRLQTTIQKLAAARIDILALPLDHRRVRNALRTLGQQVVGTCVTTPATGFDIPFGVPEFIGAPGKAWLKNSPMPNVDILGSSVSLPSLGLANASGANLNLHGIEAVIREQMAAGNLSSKILTGAVTYRAYDLDAHHAATLCALPR